MAKSRKPPMYTPIQRMAYKSCGCDPKNAPPSEDVVELIERRKLTGGFDTSPGNICLRHNIARSVNGTCIECD